MRIINNITAKRIYLQPQIICIELDNEISLALESEPPPGPEEGNLDPEFLKNNPFKNNYV